MLFYYCSSVTLLLSFKTSLQYMYTLFNLKYDILLTVWNNCIYVQSFSCGNPSWAHYTILNHTCRKSQYIYVWTLDSIWVLSCGENMEIYISNSRQPCNLFSALCEDTYSIVIGNKLLCKILSYFLLELTTHKKQ